MGKLESYLTFLGPLAVIGSGIAAAIFYFLVPKKYYLESSFAFFVFWVSASKLTGFAVMATLMKVTVFVPALLILGYILQNMKGRVARLGPLYWLIPLVFAISSLFVIRTWDASSAVPLRLTYALYWLVALLIVERFHVWDFRRAFIGMSVGYAIYSIIVISGLLFAPNNGFNVGLGRFQSYGNNPNQIAFDLIPAAGLIVYGLINSSKTWLVSRLFLVAALLSSAGAILISGSRQAVFAGAITVVAPFVSLRGLKFGFLILPLAALGGFFAMRVEGFRAGSRLLNLDTTRFQIFQAYWDSGVLFNPLGLLGQNGGMSTVAFEVGQHGHNAILYTAYAFGFVVCLFHLALIARFTLALFLQKFSDVNWFNMIQKMVIFYFLAFCLISLFGLSSVHPTFTPSFLFILFGLMAVRFNKHQAFR
ncbi:MAG: hypothetical protein ACPGO7_04280 [Alphaproteobacteria bacterium]